MLPTLTLHAGTNMAGVRCSPSSLSASDLNCSNASLHCNSGTERKWVYGKRSIA